MLKLKGENRLIILRSTILFVQIYVSYGGYISPFKLGDKSHTVNSEIFARPLFSRNLAYAKFCENKTLAKWQNTLSFMDIGKICLSRKFFTSLICLLMLFVK